MTKYIDLNRVKEILFHYFRTQSDEVKDVLLEVTKCVQEIPVADVVEVVRCKDCFYGETDPLDTTDYLCRYYGDDWNDKNHYCSHGTTIKR